MFAEKKNILDIPLCCTSFKIFVSLIWSKHVA